MIVSGNAIFLLLVFYLFSFSFSFLYLADYVGRFQPVPEPMFKYEKDDNNDVFFKFDNFDLSDEAADEDTTVLPSNFVFEGVLQI